MAYFLSCPFPPLVSRGKGKDWNVHSIYCSTGKHGSPELTLFKVLYMGKEMKSHIQLYAPSLFKIKKNGCFSKFCLQCLHCQGIALCHYFLRYSSCNPKHTPQVSALEGRTCHINYAFCCGLLLLSCLVFACWIEENVDSSLGLSQSHLKTAKNKLNPSQMGSK